MASGLFSKISRFGKTSLQVVSQVILSYSVHLRYHLEFEQENTHTEVTFDVDKISFKLRFAVENNIFLSSTFRFVFLSV